ncbi:MAG TPA: aminopeptidase [Thermoplasmata archaeon]|nr:aminopeptidase [Thermoplasmata archaeon]
MATLAANLVKNCLRIRSSDSVSIFFYPHTLELAEDIATECFRAGADAILVAYTDKFYESYMKMLPIENLKEPSVYCRALTDHSTAQFWIGALHDPSVFRRISPERMAATSEGETKSHYVPPAERKTRSLFVELGLVTRPRAKTYGFSYPAWERTIREASAVPAGKLRIDGRKLAGILETGDRVRIKANGGTDLEFSIRGRRAYVYDGVVDDEDIAAGALDAGIPAGNVNVSPIETSANGTIVFNVSQPWAGRLIRQMRWTFDDGKVTSFSGDANSLLLKKEWELSGGDRDRIGTFSIGLNPRAKYGFLSNGIVRGAVSIGIGGNDAEGGTNKPGFNHMQAVQNATVELDGKPLVRAGKLVAI